jgi:hypothetical protein
MSPGLTHQHPNKKAQDSYYEVGGGWGRKLDDGKMGRSNQKKAKNPVTISPLY